MKDITVPKSVKKIDKFALGYDFNWDAEDVDSDYEGDLDELYHIRRDDFKIYCYSGTAGETYAKDNKLTYEIIGGTSASKTTPISKASFKFSSTLITYSGKAKMPKLTVTYGGKTLVKGTDYTVSVSNAKKVGKATATVKGIGKYSGSKKLYYYVVPVKPTISKVTSAAKKKLTVQWKKNTTATGYQIQIATNKAFTKNKKSYGISKNTTVKGTISKLTSGKTYYVRMRAYKTIDGVKKYGAYSAVKTVKVK